MQKMNCGTHLFKNYLAYKFSHVRTCGQLPEGIKYPGFVYYPRYKNFKDPPYEPSKLFLIKRIKPMKGLSKKEKHLLALMNIDGERKDFGHINVVKNIPTNNACLWKIKHIIEIRPITYKGELPTNGDYSGTYLRQTGELIIAPKLKISEKQLEVTEKIEKNPNKLDYIYLRDYLKKKWLNGFYGSV